VDAFSVVVVQPGGKGVGAGFVAGGDLPVGPFGCQGAVQAFDFPVGPGAVGFDEPLLGAEGGDGVLEIVRSAVGEGVVGDDAFDPRDAAVGEECGRAGQDAGGGLPGLVTVDLGVGEACVVRDAYAMWS